MIRRLFLRTTTPHSRCGLVVQPVTQAFHHDCSLGPWTGLARFLEDGRFALDTNPSKT
jgi:hypothetical protein